ncbi:unnamed protein product [Didymodactylos carnosus]|uniref:SH3 domain-containing protein n=1 Tax=Didymodactylos carnosus TaxID=1234261 RepID=A0A8S2D861_9BILA|nr:unnamed protein product [Didymodactylos carnosus]CAF3651018.1 unnamed protein product [Didymodactylos carnosus]
MADQFRDNFVGERGYDSLKNLMKTGNDICIEAAKCFQERYDMELVYATALSKNSEKLKKIATKSQGSVANAFHQLSVQTNVESDAHKQLANTISKDISLPMKTLAETQSRARKTIEDGLNSKFKAWRDQKDTDKKYRGRSFEKCKEIESLFLKMDEIPKSTKNSVKDVSKMESSLRKTQEDLDRTERKYHEATREVEVARQACDSEMCKACDQMEQMEKERIEETSKFVQLYAQSTLILTDKMIKLSKELSDLRIIPQDDIISAIKQYNVNVPESEILLYDIYAENEHNAMSQERRLKSLLHWMQILRNDLEIQRKSKDGIESLHGFCRQNQNFSSSVNSDQIHFNRRSVELLHCLFEASLFKMETVYNRLTGGQKPYFKDEQRLTTTFMKDGHPTTMLRIPYKSINQPPTAPLELMSRIPIVPAPPQPLHITLSMQSMDTSQHQHHHSADSHRSAPPPIGFINPPHTSAGYPQLSNHSGTHAHTVAHNYDTDRNRHQLIASNTPPYPLTAMTTPRSSTRLQRVRVNYDYTARADDEISINSGDIITVLEKRPDGWYRGELGGQVGLFPGNFVEEI